MRILFSVKNPDYVRHYASVLRELASRGHDVELVKQSARNAWPSSVVALAEEHPGIRLSTLPGSEESPWLELATRFRQARQYLRFLSPRLATPALLERARKRAPRLAVFLGESLGLARRDPRPLERLIGILERCTRSAALFHRFLDDRRPDILVLTPLVVPKTTQPDLARAAKERGVRNVFAVASWDHLSSKAVLGFSPQRVFVWNDTQRQEAMQFHGVEAERIVVTGSQVFDDWFGREPSTTREDFCARLGLPHDRPLVLYVCSSLLEGSPAEAPLVVEWARHLRRSVYPVLQDCGILVRPHPRRGREWRGVDFTGLTNIACWPPAGDFPADARSKADYFDSLYHAQAVVGVNTSAMIEAAILERPVHTVLLPAYRDSQEDTVHFRYLLDGTDALLRATRSLDDHARDLAAALERRDTAVASERFVRAFVRPRGLDVPATTVFADALEALGSAPPPAPEPESAWVRWCRPVLWPFAYAAGRRMRRLRMERRLQKERALLEHRRRKSAAVDKAMDNMTVR